MQWMMKQWSLILCGKKNSFGDNEFAGNRGEGKKIIQVRCKTHTLNEYFSMAMYNWIHKKCWKQWNANANLVLKQRKSTSHTG